MASAAENSGKKIILRSSDGEVFEVDEAVAVESQTIKHMIVDDCVDNIIPIPNVTGKILSKVIEYCKKHVDAAAASAASASASASAKAEDKVASADDELKVFDADFVKVDQPTLFDLILAANYLNIKSLLDLTCQTVADMIKEKNADRTKQKQEINIEMTKQKAQRIPKNADRTKRARVEDVENCDKGLDTSADSYDGGGPTKKIKIRNDEAGVMIGDSAVSAEVKVQVSGDQVSGDMGANPNSVTRGVELMDSPEKSPENIAVADDQLIVDNLYEVEAGGTGSGSWRMGGQSSGAGQSEMRIPHSMVGYVIGKKGNNLKIIRKKTGAKVKVLELSPGEVTPERMRTVIIKGNRYQIHIARETINDYLNEERLKYSLSPEERAQERHRISTSNYGQPSAPLQLPAYSYTKASGFFPGQPPQYHEPCYSHYSQQSTTSGYPGGWDPLFSPIETQQAPQGAGHGAPPYLGASDFMSSYRGQPAIYTNYQTGYGGAYGTQTAPLRYAPPLAQSVHGSPPYAVARTTATSYYGQQPAADSVYLQPPTLASAYRSGDAATPPPPLQSAALPAQWLAKTSPPG